MVCIEANDDDLVVRRAAAKCPIRVPRVIALAGLRHRAILTLALGIGANTAILSVVNAVAVFVHISVA
jgi:hypothetical protein